MTRSIRQYFYIIFLTTFVLANAQTEERDSLKAVFNKELDSLRKVWTEEYKATIKDSITFTGQLIDFNLGGSCGTDRCAGVFIFRVTTCERKDFPKMVAVMIQCARGSVYENLIKNNFYKLKVTPNKLKHYTSVIWAPYEKKKVYYLLRNYLTKVN